MSVKIILASASPRRKEIMEMAGYEFEIRTCDTAEETSCTQPAEIVKDLSAIKARAVMDITDENEAIVIGADTIVWNDGKVLGKPKNEEDAYAMIQSISGKSHEVYTGVSIIKKENGQITKKSFAVCTKVYVNELTHQQILDYLATNESYDKAGGYAVQGIFSRHISKIEGDYFNVVGLPISKVYEELIEIYCTII